MMNAYLVFDNIFGIYNPFDWAICNKDANVNLQGTPKVVKRVKVICVYSIVCLQDLKLFVV